MSILNEITELVIKGDIMGTKAKVAEAVEQKVEATDILNNGLMPGINEIGERFAKGQIFVPNVLMSANLKVIDLGANVPAEKFVEAIKEHNPDIVGLSALLTTTMNEQGHVIEVLKQAGVRDQVKVMIGGAPVTQAWADKIGADAFTADAAAAARWAKEYVTSIR